MFKLTIKENLGEISHELKFFTLIDPSKYVDIFRFIQSMSLYFFPVLNDMFRNTVVVFKN